MEKANSEVKVSYLPSLFEWHQGREVRSAKTDMSIRINTRGQIFLSKKAAQKISECTKMVDGKFYRMEIGFSPKAIAIRPLPVPQVSEGYRFRVNDKFGTLMAACKKLVYQELVEKRKIELPFRAVLFWDAANRMLVAKLPDTEDKPGRCKLNPKGVYDW